MDSVEDIGVCEERAKTDLRAKVDRPATILDAREIRGIGVVKDPPAKGDKTWILFR